ncbi:MAG: hypothetical protein JXL84_17905 [Deltaproteobacteria bacterium]|nr:hypothetical protein [Deltaproteobacteria bacterium]
MGSRFWSVLAAVLSTVLLASPSPVPGSSGPRLVLGEKLFDAGRVKEGQIIDRVFSVSNPGDRVLEIRDVKSD